jgi:hypothetical protein
VSGPQIIHGPGAGHNMHFADREALRESRDVYYHDKPQKNFAGITYRKPKKVIELHTAGRLPACPLAESELVNLVLAFHERTGQRPREVRYPGEGPAEFRGLTVAGLGYIGLRLLPGGAIPEAVCG